MPRRGAPLRRRSLCLGVLESKFTEHSSSPRRSNALLRRTSLPRRSEPLHLGVALLRLGVPVSFVLVALFC